VSGLQTIRDNAEFIHASTGAVALVWVSLVFAGFALALKLKPKTDASPPMSIVARAFPTHPPDRKRLTNLTICK